LEKAGATGRLADVESILKMEKKGDSKDRLEPWQKTFEKIITQAICKL
jgi:hypothetical protein